MIVFVTGPPAAGKTSLARPLALALNMPLVGKDTIKEALHDGLSPSFPADRGWSRNLSEVSYRVILALLPDLPAAVVDLNLPPEWVDQFNALGPPRSQIFCRCPQPVIESRLLARATGRHPAHDDDALLDEVRSQGLRGTDPALLDGPLLEVDSSEPVDLDRVVGWVRTLGLGRA